MPSNAGARMSGNKAKRRNDDGDSGRPTFDRKKSIIAQEESRNYDKLVYWEYHVTEEQEDTPSNVATILQVHQITDELTGDTKTYYDIKYANGCCKRVLKLVPESFLSSKVPVPLPYNEGDEVLTQTLKTFWMNPKNGERSLTKPSYFSNGKARCFNDNALFFLRDGYTDEPELGFNVNLTVDPDEKYFTIPRNRFRKAMVDLTTHSAFEGIILTLILLNTIALAMIDMNPRFVDPVTYNAYVSTAEGCCELDLFGTADYSNSTCLQCPTVNMIAGKVEMFFTIAFTVEMVLKILAMGFIAGRGTYLANAWNILDFVVVVTGLMDATEVIESGVGFLRLFRLLRPLRTFSAIPPMKNMISTIINAMAALVYVMTLLIFVILLFGIIMSELFRGSLNSRCHMNHLPLQVPSVSLAEAEALGWDPLAPDNCMQSQLLSNLWTFANCSANATKLHWHKLWTADAGVVPVFFDNIDSWYYTHAALVANSTAIPNYNDGTTNMYVAHAMDYVEWVETEAAWGAEFNLTNDGLCSDAEGIAIPVSFEQCVAICYDVGLRPEYTCTNPNGVQCEYVVSGGHNMSAYDNCAGTRCDEFQTRTWDVYDPLGHPMCEKRCNRTTTVGPLEEQFPNNWDTIEYMHLSPWNSSSNVGLGPFTVNPDHDCFWMVDGEDTRYCTPIGAGGHHHCSPNRYCGSNFDAQGQPRFSSHKITVEGSYVEDLYWGVPVFDNLGLAMLAIFQSLTLEGWVDILYTVADGFNFIVAAILFVAVVLFGAFLIMNLTLAVIWMAYDREKQGTIQEADEKHRLRLRAALEAVLYNLFLSYHVINNLPRDWPTLTLAKIDNLHARLELLWQTMEKAVEPKNPCDAGALMAVIQSVLKNDVDDNGMDDAVSVKLDPSFPIIRKAILVHDHLVKNRGRFATFTVGDEVKLAIPDTLKVVQDSCGAQWTVGVDIEENEVGKIVHVIPKDEPNAGKLAVQFKKGTWLFETSMLTKDMDFEQSVVLDPDDEPMAHVGIQFLRKHTAMFFDSSHTKLLEAFDEDAQAYDKQKKVENERMENSCTTRLSRWCCHGKAFWCCGKKTALEVNSSKCFEAAHGFFTGPIFEAFIVFVIIANTVVLMMDMYPLEYEETFGTHDGNVTFDEYAQGLEIFNFVFSCIFFVELVIKNSVLGFRDYFRDAFNVFDSIIVLVSIIELIVAPPSFLGITTTTDVALGGAWSALRAFRLFRLFKLARSWRKLRMLLAVVARTLAELSWFLVLLLLFIFIFGLLGVSLFANQMRFDKLGYKIDLNNTEAFFSPEAEDSIPRSNFDDLGNAMIVVFQVLSGENWNVVMYDSIRASGLGAGAAYFIAMIILGAMVVLELFVAILLGGFGEEEDEPPPPLVMRLLTRDSKGELTEKRFIYHVAACSSRNMWHEPAAAVSCTEPAEKWKGKVVVMHGITDVGDPEAGGGSSQTAGEKNSEAKGHEKMTYTVENMRNIVDDCVMMWNSLCEMGIRAKEAGAIGLCYVGSDDDPFTVNQLETIDADIKVEVDIPILFPIEHEATVGGSNESDDFNESMLNDLQSENVMLVTASKRHGCCGGSKGGDDNDDDKNKTPGCCGGTKSSAKVTPDGADPLQGKEVTVKDNKVEYFKLTQDHGCLPQGKSLFLFKHDMPCRIVFFNIIKHPAFDQFILFIIVAGSILLAWETPLWDPDSTQSIVVSYINLVFNGIFIAEMLTKIVALGFVAHEGAYLRSAWNVLDFLIVIISIILMASQGNEDLKGLRSLRVLRALRPLRTINRAPQLKLVINALGASIWPILQTLMMISIFFIIFSTLAVTYFQGSLSACDTSSATDYAIHDDQYELILCNEYNDTSRALCREWQDLDPEIQQNWAAREADRQFAAWQNYVDMQAGRVSGLTEYAANVTAMYGTDEAYYAQLVTSDFVNANNTRIFPNYIQGPVTSRMVCEWLGYEWAPLTDQSFNNVFPSLASLYELSTTEGWIDVMWYAADARGLDMEPVRDCNKYAVLFFILFIMVGTFFAMNLFIGIICDTFAEKRSEGDGTSLFVTEEQKQWQAIQKIILKLKPFLRKREPKNPCRRCCFVIADSAWFEHFIMSLIVLNTLVLCIGYYGQPHVYAVTLDSINYALFGVFALEAIIKLLGFGGQYFSTSRGGGRDCARYLDAWNVFDLCIVIGTSIGILLSSLLPVDIQAIAGIIRTFRLLRIVRLLRGVRGLKVLLNTIAVAMPAVVNIFVLLLLFLMIFAIMGIQLFATVAHGDALNDYANFQDFFVAMLTLLRGSTGENWNGIMHDMSRITDNCRPTNEMEFNSSMCGYCLYAPESEWPGQACVECVPLDGCGSPITSKFFWYFFTLVVTYTLLNVCIAVILEAWENAETTEGANIKEEAMVAYCSEWQKYDPDGKHYIALTELPTLLQELPSPLGFLEPPATIVEVHGTPGAEDEFFILETDDGGVVSVVENGVAVPRKVLRSELRFPKATAKNNNGGEQQSMEKAVLMKRMRVRYTKSTAQAQAEVFRMQLKSQTTKEGLHVVSFLPTAVACAHRSFNNLSINEDLLGKFCKTGSVLLPGPTVSVLGLFVFCVRVIWRCHRVLSQLILNVMCWMLVQVEYRSKSVTKWRGTPTLSSTQQRF